jgi:phosphoserine phosphatase RsbU/P
MTAGPSFTTIEPDFAQLRKLTEIGRALTYTTSLDQVSRLTVERGADLLDGVAAVLMLADAEELLQVLATHGVSDERAKRFQAPLDDEVIGRLQGLLLVDEDCFLAVPLVVSGAVTGLLAVATRRPCTTADESLLSALADQAAVALESARLASEIHQQIEARRVSDVAVMAKDRALTTLAHDIRTPLGAIDAYSAIIEDEMYGPINDRQREALGRVRMSGRHLLSLLDNVMEMARLDAGVLRVDCGPLKLSDVAREAVHILLPQSEANLQTLKLVRPDPVIVIADQERVRQVLVNLIGNAVKFTPQGGAITVETAAITLDGQDWGEIRVSDTGPGIEQTEQTAIFEAYYRSEGTAQLPGVGLGLAISHALVERMGGSLHVESEVGVGSTFIARFPCAGPEHS